MYYYQPGRECIGSTHILLKATKSMIEGNEVDD